MTDKIAGRVKRYREALGLNQRDAADAAGISQSMWFRIESGEKEPTLGQLSSIASALGCTLESFTDESPVRDRLQVAARTSKTNLSAAERIAFDDIKERLTFMMEVDAHLRYIRVGVHNG